jgi:uncharacterized protein involved in type VI secretion and phage assembly
MMDMLAGAQSNEADQETDGYIRGLAVATVTQNKDDGGLARVRVRLSWQPEGEESYWARLAMPMAGGERGTYFVPEVGDEVLVGFERGDMSHPYVIGALWNGQLLPPETNSDGNNDRRLIRSRSGHQLLFDDGDPPKVELKLEDGKHLLIDDKGVKLEDTQGNTITIATGSGDITIESKGQLKLKSQRISIEAGASMEIKAAGTLILKGAVVQIN